MSVVSTARRSARVPLGIAASLLTEAVGELAAATHLVRTGGTSIWASAAPGVLLAGVRPAPVMLVHGLGADSSCFQTMACALHRAGHTVSPRVRNIVLAGGGHLSLPADSRCVDLVRAELEAADHRDAGERPTCGTR